MTADQIATEALECRADDGARLAVRRAGNPDGPCLLVGHGVGFAIDGFARMWTRLAARFDLVLYDMRGHGRGDPADPAAISPGRIVADLRAVLDLVGDRPVHGLLHSYAALTALRLEASRPGSFAGLVLAEPPIPLPAGDPEFAAFDAGQRVLAERAGRRRDRVTAPAELVERYARRDRFAALEPDALEELVAALLRRDGDGWRLACAPAVEAAFYATNQDDGLWERLANVACPVLVLAGGAALEAGDYPAQMAGRLARAGGFDHLELAGCGHMMMLERPAAVAGIAAGYLISSAETRAR